MHAPDLSASALDAFEARLALCIDVTAGEALAYVRALRAQVAEVEKSNKNLWGLAEQARRERDAARGILASVEFASTSRNGRACPSCYGLRECGPDYDSGPDRGHKRGCILRKELDARAALAAERGEKP
jgi:hypothetical protein